MFFKATLNNLISHQLKKGFAVNEKMVKNRMKAVGNIKKITKAMKMVASSKMKNELNRLNNGKNFGVGLIDKIFENDSYLRKKYIESPSDKILLVPITTDKYF